METQELTAEQIAAAADEIAPPDAATVETVEEKKETPPPPPAPSEAEQTLEMLASLGLTKDNASQVVGAARAFQQYGYLIEKDPRQFMKILKGQSPEVYESFINGVTDEYLETHEAPAPAKGDTPPPAASRELLQLQQQVAEITGVLRTSAQQNATNIVVQGYRDKVEEVVSKMGLEKPGEIKAIKAMLRDSLETDSAATQRIWQGNYVDVARHATKVMKEFTDETIADNQKEHETRERTVERGKKEIPNGPSSNGKNTNPADSWDNAENALALALTKARGK